MYICASGESAEWAARQTVQLYYLGRKCLPASRLAPDRSLLSLMTERDLLNRAQSVSRDSELILADKIYAADFWCVGGKRYCNVALRGSLASTADFGRGPG